MGAILERIRSQVITGPAENEDEGDEVVLWANDDPDTDDWAFVVAACVEGEENFEEEAEAHYYRVISRTAREFKDRAKGRRDDHAAALAQLARLARLARLA